MEEKSRLTIRKVEVFAVAIPRRRLHSMAFASESLSISNLVRIETDQGIIGLGEARVMKNWGGDHSHYYGETPETVAQVIRRYLGPCLQEQDPFAIERLTQKMHAAVKGYPYAKAALNMALYDIKGKALGVPVYELLGGLVQERIRLMHSIGIMSPDAAAREAAAVAADGIKDIKVKVGLDAENDCATVEAIRKSVGDSLTITLDANQGYRNAKTAIRVLRQLSRYNIAIAEQPVEGLDEMAEVTRQVDMDVMADESCWTPRDVLEISRRRAADCLSVYVAKAGGIGGAMKVAAVAEAAGLDFNLNGSGELGVGNAASVHTIAANPGAKIGAVIPLTAPAEKQQTKTGNRSYLDDIVTDAYEYEDGHLLVPRRPGLGVELDEAKVEKYWYKL